ILSGHNRRNALLDPFVFLGRGFFKEKHNWMVLSPRETRDSSWNHKNVGPITDSSIVRWEYHNSHDHLVEHPMAHLGKFGRHQCFPYGIRSRSLRVHRDIVWDFYS